MKLTMKCAHWLQYRTFFPDLPRPGNHMTESGLTYRDAGVDIDAGDELVERIKPVVKKTMRKEVLAGIGGFGALVEVPLDRYRKPVLVSGTDGVGTKLRLAIDTGRHDKIGIDLVAMCANDIAVSGAEPLFFLDYYATGKLRVDVAESVIRGIAEGCELAGAVASFCGPLRRFYSRQRLMISDADLDGAATRATRFRQSAPFRERRPERLDLLEDFTGIADDQIMRAREFHHPPSLSKRFEPFFMISNALAGQ